MGKRARAKGVTGAALRAVRVAAMARDEEAALIAERVYGVAVATREDAPFPLAVFAPVQMAAELAARGVVRAFDMAPQGTALEGAAVREVAAYVTAGFFAMVAEFDPAHFDEWRRRTDGDDYGG